MAWPHTFYRNIPADRASRGKRESEGLALIPPGGPISRYIPVECIRPLPHSIILCIHISILMLCYFIQAPCHRTVEILWIA